jgi:Zn-dependent metalloprotease
MTEPGDMVVFKGAKIDGRQVKSAREPQTGDVAVDGFLSGPLKGAPEKAASRFIRTNGELFAEDPATLKELRVDKIQRSPAGYHVTFEQVHQGVVVEGAGISVHMTRDKRVHAAYGHLKPGVSILDVPKMAENGIDEDEARQIALSSLPRGAKKALPLTAEQVIVADEEPRLAWKVVLATGRPAGEWAVWVDVENGDVLHKRELSVTDQEAQP